MNEEVISFLKNKLTQYGTNEVMVRIPYFDETCANFDYVEIRDLIELLEKKVLFLKKEDLNIFIEK